MQVNAVSKKDIVIKLGNSITGTISADGSGDDIYYCYIRIVNPQTGKVIMFSSLRSTINDAIIFTKEKMSNIDRVGNVLSSIHHLTKVLHNEDDSDKRESLEEVLDAVGEELEMLYDLSGLA